MSVWVRFPSEAQNINIQKTIYKKNEIWKIQCRKRRR